MPGQTAASIPPGIALSESAIQDLAPLMYATKVFVKLHREFLLNRIHKVGAIVIIYTIAISYPITESKIQFQCAHVRLSEQ